MSKRCDLVCRKCGDRTSLRDTNWRHRELHDVLQCAPLLIAMQEILCARGFDLEPGWRREALWFVQAHDDHMHEIRVIDEYGAEWPCTCRGDHTGPCK